MLILREHAAHYYVKFKCSPHWSAVYAEIIDDVCTVTHPRAYFINKKWDGKVRLFKRNRFPAGFIYEVVTALKARGGAKFKVRHNDPLNLSSVSEFPKLVGVSRYGYQKKAARLAFQHRRGIINVATAGGKTEIMCSIIAALDNDVRLTILVGQKDLMSNAAQRIAKRIKGADVGLFYGDQKDWDARIIVAVVNSLVVDEDDPNHKRVQYLLKQQGVVLLDECHLAPNNTLWKNPLKKMSSAFMRIGLSATVNYTAYEKFNSLAEIGPVIFTKTAKDLSDAGYTERPTVRFIPFKNDLSCSLSYQKQYKFGIVESHRRLRVIIDMVEVMVKEGLTVVVFAWWKHRHCQDLYNALCRIGLRVDFVHGDIKLRERDRMIRDLDSKKLSVVVADSVWKLGVDIPSLDVVFNAGSLKSERLVAQMAGRVSRKAAGKSSALYVDIFDYCEHELHEYVMAKKTGNMYRRKCKGHKLTWHSWERFLVCKEMGFEIEPETLGFVRKSVQPLIAPRARL